MTLALSNALRLRCGWYTVLLLPFVVVLPESPRYLLVTRQGNRAKDVLERIARVNGTTLPFGSLKNLPEETSDQNVAERVAR